MKIKLRIRDLRDIEHRSTEEAARRLMVGDFPGSKRAHEQAEIAKNAIQHMRDTSLFGRLLPIAVALVCGSIASVLAVYRIPTANLAAQVSCTSMALTPSEPYAWRGNARLAPSQVRFEKFFASLEPLDPDESPGPDNSRGALNLARGNAALKSVSFEPGTKVALELDRAGQLQLFASRGQADAQLVFWGRVQLELETDGNVKSERMNVDVPETLALARTDRGIVPSLLQFDPGARLELPIAEVDAVSFSREIIEDGATRFQTSLVTAKLSILDTDEKVTLGPNQSLTLVGFEGQIRRLSIDGDISLALTGTAEDIVVSSGEIRRSLVPTYLAFMYQNQQIALVWSGVVFLWGMLWSVGRFVTRGR